MDLLHGLLDASFSLAFASAPLMKGPSNTSSFSFFSIVSVVLFYCLLIKVKADLFLLNVHLTILKVMLSHHSTHDTNAIRRHVMINYIALVPCGPHSLGGRCF